MVPSVRMASTVSSAWEQLHPAFLLREAALAIMRAWPPGSAIAGKAPRYPPG